MSQTETTIPRPFTAPNLLAVSRLARTNTIAPLSHTPLAELSSMCATFKQTPETTLKSSPFSFSTNGTLHGVFDVCNLHGADTSKVTLHKLTAKSRVFAPFRYIPMCVIVLSGNLLSKQNGMHVATYTQGQTLVLGQVSLFQEPLLYVAADSECILATFAFLPLSLFDVWVYGSVVDRRTQKLLEIVCRTESSSRFYLIQIWKALRLRIGRAIQYECTSSSDGCKNLNIEHILDLVFLCPENSVTDALRKHLCDPVKPLCLDTQSENKQASLAQPLSFALDIVPTSNATSVVSPQASADSLSSMEMGTEEQKKAVCEKEGKKRSRAEEKCDEEIHGVAKECRVDKNLGE